MSNKTVHRLAFVAQIAAHDSLLHVSFFGMFWSRTYSAVYLTL